MNVLASIGCFLTRHTLVYDEYGVTPEIGLIANWYCRDCGRNFGWMRECFARLIDRRAKLDEAGVEPERKG